MLNRKPLGPSYLSKTTSLFIDQLKAINDLNSLSDAMSRITKDLGFGVFVLGQLPSVTYEGVNFMITDFPDRWRKAMYSRLMFGDDPVIDALTDAGAPFLWEDTPGFLNPSPRQKEYIAACVSFGLSRGYAVPIKAPGEPVGVVSFATDGNAPVERDSLPFASYIANAAYRRALVLVKQTRASSHPQIPLTDVELACLAGIARGLSNYAIARKHSLSSADYSAAVTRMHAKLGYANRVQAVVRGLQLGLINFHDSLLG